jgi:t-SNARE complex subunit (syntaxin)
MSMTNQSIAGFTPATILSSIAPYLIILIIVIILIVVFFGVQPTIGGLKI